MIFLKLTQVEMDDKKRNERRKKIDGWSLWKMKYKWKLRNNHFTKWCMAQFWRELSEHFYIICNESPTFWLKPGIHKLFSLTSLESSAFLSNFFAILLSSTWLHIVDCARHHKRVKLWRKVVLMIYLRLSLPFEPVAVECFLMKCKSRKCVDRSLSHYLFTRKALIFFGWFANLWIFDNVQGSENAFNGVEKVLQRKLQQYNKLKWFFCGCFFFSARFKLYKKSLEKKSIAKTGINLFLHHIVFALFILNDYSSLLEELFCKKKVKEFLKEKKECWQ